MIESNYLGVVITNSLRHDRIEGAKEITGVNSSTYLTYKRNYGLIPKEIDFEEKEVDWEKKQAEIELYSVT